MGAATPRSRTDKKRVARPAPPPLGRRGVLRAWAPALLLVAVTFAVYSPVLKHPFVNYDDVDYVTENPHVQQGLSLATLRWAMTSTALANWHPLTWISHALDCDFFGLEPAGHHFSSLVLHAVNALLVFLLLKRVTGREWRSLLAAAVFGLHPINVESVAWVAERKTVLSMFFLLLTLAAYGWYARRPRIGRYLLVACLFVLALAAKPMVVTLPFALLLLDFWPLQRVEHRLPPAPAFPAPQFSLRVLILEKLPLVALSAASCVVTLVAQRPAMKTIQTIPFRERVVNAVYSYLMYVYKAFWPMRLSVFYSPQGGRLAAWQIALCLTFLVLVSALVWKARVHAYLVIGWLWFLGTLVPMIGLVQVGEQGMADRYAYLPLLGVFVAVVWCVADWTASKEIGWRYGATAAAVVLLLMVWLTRRQIQTWESTYAMWSHSLLITPENFVAEDFVGTTLLQNAFNARGESCAEEALVHFQNAVRINPRDALGHLNVGFCLQAHGNLPEAIAEYEIALQSARNKYLRSRSLLNLGAAYQESGDFGTSRKYYDEALKIYPRDPDILRGVAKLDAEEKSAMAGKRTP